MQKFKKVKKTLKLRRDFNIDDLVFNIILFAGAALIIGLLLVACYAAFSFSGF